MGIGLGYSSSNNKSSSNVWGPQATALQNLYQGVGDFTSQPNSYLDQAISAGEQAIPDITGYTDQAMPAWARSLAGGSAAGFDPNLDPINQMAGGQGSGFDTYRGLMNPQGNPYLDQMAGRGLNNMYENFSENIMPGITQNAAFTGGMGGSRSGVAEGIATKGLMDAGGDYLTNLYGGQYAGDQTRALQAAGGYNADIMRGVTGAADIARGGDITSLNAIQQGPAATNLGFTGSNMYNQLYGMQQQPFQFQSDIYGRPTVLNKSKGSSVGFDMSVSGEK